MMSLNGSIFRVAGPLWVESGELPSQRPVFPDLCLNKSLNKERRRRWCDTPSSSLWRHCNATVSQMNGISYKIHKLCFVALFVQSSTDSCEPLTHWGQYTNFKKVSVRNMNLKTPSTKWRTFRLSLNVSTHIGQGCSNGTWAISSKGSV